MILVLNISRRERDELGQALSDHLIALEQHKVEGRAKTTRGVLQKIYHAYDEAAQRPPAGSK